MKKIILTLCLSLPLLAQASVTTKTLAECHLPNDPNFTQARVVLTETKQDSGHSLANLKFYHVEIVNKNQQTLSSFVDLEDQDLWQEYSNTSYGVVLSLNVDEPNENGNQRATISSPILSGDLECPMEQY